MTTWVKLVVRAAFGAALALPLVSLAGCGWTEIHEVVLRRPTAPANHEVELYMTGQPLPHPIYEIAFLQVVGRGSEANLEDLVKALAQRARMLGCDAVANIQVQQGYSVAHAFGVCVQYASNGPASPPPPAPPPTGAAPPQPAPPGPSPSPPSPPEKPGVPQGTSI